MSSNLPDDEVYKYVRLLYDVVYEKKRLEIFSSVVYLAVLSKQYCKGANFPCCNLVAPLPEALSVFICTCMQKAGIESAHPLTQRHKVQWQAEVMPHRLS